MFVCLFLFVYLFVLQFSKHLGFHLDRKNELITTTALVLRIKTRLTMCRIKTKQGASHDNLPDVCHIQLYNDDKQNLTEVFKLLDVSYLFFFYYIMML